MEGINKITVVNNEKDCLNKSFQLHRFAKLQEWIHKYFHTDIRSLTWTFKKSKMGRLAWLDFLWILKHHDTSSVGTSSVASSGLSARIYLFWGKKKAGNDELFPRQEDSLDGFLQWASLFQFSWARICTCSSLQLPEGYNSQCQGCPWGICASWF